MENTENGEWIMVDTAITRKEWSSGVENPDDVYPEVSNYGNTENGEWIMVDTAITRKEWSSGVENPDDVYPEVE